MKIKLKKEIPLKLETLSEIKFPVILIFAKDNKIPAIKKISAFVFFPIFKMVHGGIEPPLPRCKRGVLPLD